MKGQISIEYTGGALLFFSSLMFVVTGILGTLPQFTNSINENSLETQLWSSSTHLMSNPGRWDSPSNQGTDWHNHVASVTHIGLEGEDANLNREKINALTDMDYDKAKILLKIPHDFNIEFTEFAVIDTSKSFQKNITTDNQVEETFDSQPVGAFPAGWKKDTPWDSSSPVFEIDDTTTKSGSGAVYSSENSQGSPTYVIRAFKNLSRLYQPSRITVSIYLGGHRDDGSARVEFVSDPVTDDTGSRENPNTVFSAHFSPGANTDNDLSITGLSSDVSVNLDQWYTVEWRNIDWNTGTMDVYLDGTLQQDDASFTTPSSTGIEALWHVNDDKQFRFDEVQLTEPGSDSSTILTEPVNDQYVEANETVRYGSVRNNDAVKHVLVTAHNGTYDTVYMSEDWDFRDAIRLGSDGNRVISFDGRRYRLLIPESGISMSDGRVVMLRRPLGGIGTRTPPSEGTVVTAKRFGTIENNPVRMDVEMWGE